MDFQLTIVVSYLSKRRSRSGVGNGYLVHAQGGAKLLVKELEQPDSMIGKAFIATVAKKDLGKIAKNEAIEATLEGPLVLQQKETVSYTND